MGISNINKEEYSSDYWCHNPSCSPLNALKDRQSATDEDLDNCVDDAVTGRYAANLNIEE